MRFSPRMVAGKAYPELSRLLRIGTLCCVMIGGHPKRQLHTRIGTLGRKIHVNFTHFGEHANNRTFSNPPDSISEPWRTANSTNVDSVSPTEKKNAPKAKDSKAKIRFCIRKTIFVLAIFGWPTMWRSYIRTDERQIPRLQNESSAKLCRRRWFCSQLQVLQRTVCPINDSNETDTVEAIMSENIDDSKIFNKRV